MKDIEGIEDIKVLVDTFYEKVRNDDVLGPIFETRIDSWPKHLETMYRFWNAALFQVREYKGNPFLKHATLPIDERHFQRWLDLFYETLDERFKGEVCADAKYRSFIMANTFSSRIRERNVLK
jgi:hemoglobin